MASSLISSSHHVDFDSVFGMEDTGMVQMFESLIATGVKNFLGCPAIFSEAALTEFFANGSVRDGLVVSTVNGVHVEISEKVFAEAFELPIDGLIDVSDVPKNLVFDARSLFSVSQEQTSKGFCNPNLCYFEICSRIGVGRISSIFPASRVLTEKTIHRYVAVNDKVSGEADNDAPRVKKTPLKKAVSHKRPAVDFETAPVVKKKRTTKGKPLVIAQEAVPLKIVEAAADAPVEKPPVPKRKSQKRKRRLILEDDLEIDEPVAGRFTAEHPVKEATTGVPVVVPVFAPATDDPDAVIKKVLNQLDVVFQTDDGEQPQGTVVEETVIAAKEPHWFDLPYDDLIAKLDAERPVVTASDTDEDVETMDAGAAGGDQQVQFSEEEPEDVEMREDMQVDELIDADEKMSLEDILMTIPVDVPLASAGIEITKITMGKEIQIPGVDEKTQYLASLPKIPLDNKGKVILVEKDPIKGNPAKEHYYLICADIDLLVHLRAQVIDAVDQFFHSFSFKKLATINIEDLSKKEEQVLCWGETETTHVALNRKRYILLKNREVLVRNFLESWKNNFVPGKGSSTIDLKNLLSLDLKSYQQKVSIQVGAAALDTVDVRREVKAVNAKVDILSSRLDDVKKDVEATKEAISHQLLEFQSQAQANHIVLTDQLGQLVDYINRGGNAKKGEGESSRGTQPPPAVQIRDSSIASGDVVRTTDISQADVDAANRQILERMMREDRERERERRIKSRSGSYKRHMEIDKLALTVCNLPCSGAEYTVTDYQNFKKDFISLAIQMTVERRL
ncbi:hypothetical protein F511_30590 [Dorcoceras hygrometricum]|uniref:Dystroglycan-like n=1 Tax=Dorcoceras hygrometricum TaxID=472368 RepID=A0A2Z7AQX0_9LAMI|nr:hypothetical protein F511_30590 [Dorcoceras hygrometricum]